MAILKISNEVVSSETVKIIEAKLKQKLSDCYQCGKCTAGCPVAYEMDYTPNQVIRMLQLGQTEKVFTARTIWICASCVTCSTRCPKEFKIAELMDVLREISYKKGKTNPQEKSIVAFHKTFLDTVKYVGKLFEFALIGIYKLRSGDFFSDLNIAPIMIKMGKLKFFPHITKNRGKIKRIFKKTTIK